MEQHPLSTSRAGTPLSRRAFLGVAAVAAATPVSAAETSAATAQGLTVPLRDPTGLQIDGPHRFLSVAGLTGFQPTSLSTRASVKTDLHRGSQGTVDFWFSPLEDLTFFPSNQAASRVPFNFPFLSDTFPGREIDPMRFGVYLTSGYPAILAKFADGAIWSKLDFGLAPFVYAEKALLRQGLWYHLALTWDRVARRLVIYLNGMMAGHNLQADNFQDAAPVLYLGNPMMLLRDLRLQDHALSGEGIRSLYQQARPAENDLPDSDWRQMLSPAFLRPLDIERDASWTPVYECPFDRPGDLDGWVRQGPGEKFLGDFRMEQTPEGLFIRTPDALDKETRMYLWSQRTFEGDQWIEFDFRLESPKGLALLSICASGMQREDFIADHGVPPTGSMSTILRDVRNYHWEFVRRVEAMRTDVETQYVAKNPFGHRLHYGCIPRLEPHRWYRLRCLKAGPRLHGAIDGETVFDLEDDPFHNNGPVYNFGRIALRQMYHTALRYRNLVVYQRTPSRNAAG